MEEGGKREETRDQLGGKRQETSLWYLVTSEPHPIDGALLMECGMADTGHAGELRPFHMEAWMRIECAFDAHWLCSHEFALFRFASKAN